MKMPAFLFAPGIQNQAPFQHSHFKLSPGAFRRHLKTGYSTVYYIL